MVRLWLTWKIEKSFEFVRIFTWSRKIKKPIDSKTLDWIKSSGCSLDGHDVVAGDEFELWDDVHGDEVEQEGDRETQSQVEDPDRADGWRES